MNGRPRLLVLASTFPSSPSDPTPGFVRDLCREEARSYDTLVLLPAVPGAPPAEDADGIRLRRFRFFPRRWEDLADGAIIENVRTRKSRLLQVPAFLGAETMAVRRAVREFRPDVVHAHWLIPQGLAAVVANRTVPLVATAHGGDVYALRDPASTALLRAVVRRSAFVTTQNAEMRERLVHLGCPPDRAVVLPVGADTERFRSVAATRHRDPRRIVFVGRLVEKKGLAVLLDALRSLDAESFHLVVIGDGPQRSELERRAGGLPVSFTGALSRAVVAEQYAEASIAVFPSVRASSGDQDGLPLALIEAMASGCAVVGSDLPGLAEAIEHGRSGLLAPAGEAPALAAVLATLLRDGDLRSKLGDAARERAELFSAARAGERFVELLDRVRDEAARRRDA